MSAITQTGSVTQLDPLLTAPSALDGSSSVGSTGTTTTVSDFASVLNELQQLQQSDPTKFKEVTASVAKTLDTDASAATGQQAQLLSQMANRFEQASQTGTMTPLEPSGAISGHHGGHHHHHAAVQSYQAQQSSSSSTDTDQQTPFDLAQVVQNALQQVKS